MNSQKKKSIGVRRPRKPWNILTATILRSLASQRKGWQEIQGRKIADSNQQTGA